MSNVVAFALHNDLWALSQGSRSPIADQRNSGGLLGEARHQGVHLSPGRTPSNPARWLLLPAPATLK